MKAAVCERYGPPEMVVIRDVPEPALGDEDVLVRVRATTVNIGDVRVRAVRVPRGLALPTRLAMGLRGPKQPIFGVDVAGVVEKIGAAVTRFKPGDRVVASRGFKMGAHAELLAVPETGVLVAIPDGVTDADAVAVLFGGVTALAFLDQGKLAAGEHLLVNGASGAVGVMAVQLAKLRGARVTGVCSAANLELVRSLGAGEVIDYAVRDFTSEATKYDLVMDNVGNAPYARVRRLLAPGGRFLMVIGDLPQMLAATWQKNVVSPAQGDAAFNPTYYRLLMDLLAKRQIRAVIERSFPFEAIVEAHRLVDTGHKRGSVVVTVP